MLYIAFTIYSYLKLYLLITNLSDNKASSILTFYIGYGPSTFPLHRKMVHYIRPSYRTKHIDVRYSFIKDYIKKGLISCEYCRSEEIIADILAKTIAIE